MTVPDMRSPAELAEERRRTNELMKRIFGDLPKSEPAWRRGKVYPDLKDAVTGDDAKKGARP